MANKQAVNGQPAAYNATPATRSDGDPSGLEVDVSGNLKTVSQPSSYATDDTAMPATPVVTPVAAEYRASATTYTDGDATVLQSDVNGNLKVTLATKLDETNDHVTNHPVGMTYVNLTASGQVLAAPGVLKGMYVNSTNAGTVKIYDNTAGSGTVINNTITPAIGYHSLGDAACATGAYATIGGTALDVTFYVETI